MDEPIRLRPRVVVCSRRHFGRDVHGRSGVQPLNTNAVARESPTPRRVRVTTSR